MMWRGVLLGIGVLFLAACETTKVAPIDAGVTPEMDTDEAGLWYQVDKAEEQLKTAAVVVRDEALNDYVRGVACRVTGPDYCDDMRVYIIEAPYLNASMAPNGLMQVWTGLLLRAENEAQLAFVLGHEFIHYKERHSLEQFRSYKNAANMSMVLSLGAAVGRVPEAAQIGSIVLTGRLYGFGRDKEREADEGGFRAAVDAGYSPDQGAALWDYVIDEVEASSSRRRQRQVARASIFSTHPLTQERVTTLRDFARAQGEGGYLGQAEHRAAISPYLNEWLNDDIARRDLGAHLYLINHLLAAGGDEGVLYFRQGEAYRVRREEGDQALALAAYQRATTYADAPPAAWREIGNVQRRQGDTIAAGAAYSTYLVQAPDATDRALVESYLKRWSMPIPERTVPATFPALSEEEADDDAS
ncbi:M48 family metallopeptidase [Parvularcula sp. LCG005]|uniref:M48 family metallopeptidase n=1 Tax=Parvularcula sp. LCG005 TaxID=3078805 RepID=UPI002943580C|nr:M48 family metalloprotease [Parvularcula sp. LCG005]WOI51984.1 M48 family metalloprotease [Parvularcula sp. LCG005]